MAALCDTGGCEVGGGTGGGVVEDIRERGGVLELTTVELLGGLCISVGGFVGVSLGGGDLGVLMLAGAER